jgi:hypothetical protein
MFPCCWCLRAWPLASGQLHILQDVFQVQIGAPELSPPQSLLLVLGVKQAGKDMGNVFPGPAGLDRGTSRMSCSS